MRIPTPPGALSLLAAISVGMAAPAFSQNEVHHHDGTTETYVRFAAPGGSPTDAQTWYQRLPGDQIGGATGLMGISTVLLDLNGANTEKIRFRVSQGNRDQPGSEFLRTSRITVSGGGSGAQIFLVTFDWTGGTGTPVPLPFSPGCNVPGRDIYGAVQATSAGGSANGLLIGASIGNPGEQFNPNVRSDYDPTRTGNSRGLAYFRNTPTDQLFVLNNVSYWIRQQFADDVVQPFAENFTRFTGPSTQQDGQNPNYGYAGIWPDPSASDRFGVRLGSSFAPGGLAVLFASPTLGPPVFVPSLGGTFCLGTPLIRVATSPLAVPGSFTFSAPPEDVGLLRLAATSEAVFGPFPFLSSIPSGTRIRQQAIAFDVFGNASLSTMATTSF